MKRAMTIVAMCFGASIGWSCQTDGSFAESHSDDSNVQGSAATQPEAQPIAEEVVIETPLEVSASETPLEFSASEMPLEVSASEAPLEVSALETPAEVSQLESNPSEAEEQVLHNDTIEQEVAVNSKPVELESPSPIGEAEIAEIGDLSLGELIIARGIEDKQPMEPGSTFDADLLERIYVFLNVENPSREASQITVSWLPEGTESERGTVDVSVGAQRSWRTWAYTSAVKKPGRYIVRVRDAEGDVMAEAPFEIVSIN